MLAFTAVAGGTETLVQRARQERPGSIRAISRALEVLRADARRNSACNSAYRAAD